MLAAIAAAHNPCNLSLDLLINQGDAPIRWTRQLCLQKRWLLNLVLYLTICRITLHTVAAKSTGQKKETTRQLVHSMLELRDELRRSMQKRLRDNNIDLTYEMHQVMACLWKKDGISQQVLADLTLRDKAAITFLIDNLCKRELVIRQENATDRRSKLIYLTNKGRLLGRKVEPWVHELFTVAGNGLTEARLQECIQTIGKMCQNVRTS